MTDVCVHVWVFDHENRWDEAVYVCSKCGAERKI